MPNHARRLLRCLLWETVATQETRFHEGNDTQDRYRLTVTHDGVVVGTMVVIDKHDHVKVHDVAVIPTERRKGFGTALYRHAIDLTRRLGRPALVSDYNVSADAAAVWRALGGTPFSDAGAQRWRLTV